jgi:hypothetical protein
MPRTIFITNRFGPKILYDKEGLIGKFTDTKNDILETNEGLIRNDMIKNVWYMVLEDQALIDRVKATSSFQNKIIQETDSEPMIGKVNNLKSVSDPNAYNPEATKRMIEESARKLNAENNMKLAAERKNMEAEKEQMIADSRRYAVLYSQITKKNGGYVANADPELIKEFEQLQQKLGIEEPKEEAEA